MAYSNSIEIIFFFVIASGWLTSILLALFVIASGWLAQFHLVLLVLLVLPVGGLCIASGWYVYAVSFVVLIFPVLDCSVLAALGLKRAAPYVVWVFLLGQTEI